MDYGSNIRFYDEIQSYFRNTHMPTLLLWGELDQYLSVDAARAYKRDLPDVDLVTLEGGHWLLESHPEEVISIVREYFSKTM
jgi:pimeloyl-ACP methyl ester carboxylesterase